MPVSISEQRSETEARFARLLREWRQKRRLSQFDLALASGVSPRHVSFLESGRANPSRSMILQLSETLDIPLRDRNALLTAAGFAPVFRTSALDDPGMAPVLRAVRLMLNAHEPYPAIAIDRAWNIRMSNGPFDMLGAMLGEDVWARVGGEQRNLMRLMFHPEGIRPLVTNWPAVGPIMWRRAQREAEDLGGAEMKTVLDELAPYQDHKALRAAADMALVPVMAFNMLVNGISISMFTVVATIGTAQDVTTDELRIETLFPADAATEALFRGVAAGTAS